MGSVGRGNRPGTGPGRAQQSRALEGRAGAAAPVIAKVILASGAWEWGERGGGSGSTSL